MSAVWVALSVLVPLLMACVWPVGRCRRSITRLAVAAPLPALGLAFWGDDCQIELPWLLLGASWGLDLIGRVFLGFTAALWFITGVYRWGYLADSPGHERFVLFWLMTMTGHLGLILSRDVASFLAFYTLMSFSAYGLVTHDRAPASLRAGRIYLMLAVLSEVLLFWAAVIGVQQSGSLQLDQMARGVIGTPVQDVVVGMVLLGFGIKLGIMPLHFWLPLAHPAAPTPASAILSGAIIKVGLLGWMRFLPVGEVSMPNWATLCVVLGFTSALIAALIGLCQSNPKALLAYSSISQMGLLATGFGAALFAAEKWSTISAALLVFSVHHAISKAALFMGVGVVAVHLRSRWMRLAVVVGLTLAAASLAGWPLTSGYAAKKALKDALATTPMPWAASLPWLLSMTGVTTTVLVARFLYLIWPSRQVPHGSLSIWMASAWATVTLAIITAVPALASLGVTPKKWTSLNVDSLWAALWPSGIAAVVMIVALTIPRLRNAACRVVIPSGDIVGGLEAIWHRCRHPWIPSWLRKVKVIQRGTKDSGRLAMEYPLMRKAERIEEAFASDLSAGIFFALAIVILLALLLMDHVFV